MRRASLLVAVLAGASLPGVCLPSPAAAKLSAKLTASLTPLRLGQGTTLGFAVHISTTSTKLPPPLTKVDFHYPAGLAIGLSGLGVATCTAETLEQDGPEGCPSTSVMGFGSARAEISIGPKLLYEIAEITIVRAPDQDGHFTVFFYAAGAIPVNAQIVLVGVLLPASAPFGGRVDITVPLIPTVSRAPDVSIIALRATLGPRGIVYHEHVGGKTVTYKPNGIMLPKSCPKLGFQFAAGLSFDNGANANATAKVPCPARKRARGAAVSAAMRAAPTRSAR